MAKKISELDLVTSLGQTDQFPVVQGGVTKRATISLLPSGGGSGGGGGGGAFIDDRQVFCSKTGNDTTGDGLSWKTAVKTLAKAKDILSFNSGAIYLGIGDFEAFNIALRANQRIIGVTRQGSDGGGTAIVLNQNGTLINLDEQTNPGLYHLTLKFGSASVVGKLVSMSNAFTCTFIDVAFRGVATNFKGQANKSSGTTGQIGVSLTNNAGDSRFYGCEFDLLGIGVDNQTTVNYFTDCNFTSNLTAVKNGDLTGQARLAGIVIHGGTMRGWGNYYLDCGGTSYSTFVAGTFFDGQADVAVRVGNINGSNGYGPWIFAIISPFISGAITSLELNAALVTSIGDGCMFGDSYTDGQHPNSLVVGGNGAYIPKGRLGAHLNVRGNDLGALLPSAWQKF